MDELIEKYVRPEKFPGTACKGCGLRLGQKKVLEAIAGLCLGLDDLIWGTGIGCSGRQTFAFFKGDTFAGTHGRVYAMATGLRLALPPEKKIILTVGDGDAFSIGFLHLLNCARRNLDITVIVFDNLGYQSTGGQYGVTTPIGSLTDSSPYGAWESNWTENGFDVLKIIKEAGATFLARHTVLQGDDVVESIKSAILNPGFSLVQIIYPCITHYGAQAIGTRDVTKIYDWFRKRTDSSASDTNIGTFTTGIIHDASGSRPEFAAVMRDFVSRVQKGELGVKKD